jgi:hypothetical protein
MALSSASTTACSKILLQSLPKFLFHKISVPPKRWNKSRKFRQFEANVSWILPEIEYHYTTDITFVMKKVVKKGLRGRWWGFGGAVIRASAFRL